MGGAVEPVRVECRSDGAYADRPTALHWEGVRLDVVAVEDRRRTPQGLAFRVRVIDGRVFELEYDELNDAWQARSV